MYFIKVPFYSVFAGLFGCLTGSKVTRFIDFDTSECRRAGTIMGPFLFQKSFSTSNFKDTFSLAVPTGNV
ncbi:MAG: hypothetical protein IPK08_06735 [Bacteroidetes bacterium]|nr:hypothetical protein [Bacteroidota bacterium]